MATVWIQRYDPLGNWLISTLVAALPVLVLLGLLASGRASAWKAALAGLATACGVAWLVFGMPATMIAASMAVGMVFAVLRIVWLIVAAVFLYDITVATGQFEVMKASVARLSADRRLPGGAGRVLLRGVHRGGRRLRRPGGDLRGLPGRIGVSAIPGGLALLDRQHGTGRLGRHRHPHPDPEQGHRAGCPRLERHLGPDLADPLAGDSVLAGSHDDQLAGDRGRLVSALGHRRNIRLGPVPLVELRRFRAGRHRLVGCQHGGGSDRDPPLASSARPGVSSGTSTSTRFRQPNARRPDNEPGPTLTARRIARAWMPFALLTVTVLVWGIPAIKPWGTPAVKDWLDQQALLEAGALLAPSQDRQGPGGDRARDAPSPRISRRPRSRSSRCRRRGRPSFWPPWPAATCSVCRRRRWRDSSPGPSSG